MSPTPAEATLGRLAETVEVVDAWLDAAVAPGYRDEPLAQDWARVAKASEEVGEAVDALIRWTGQNPRKGVCGTLDELLDELADVATAGLYAIQHFTKDSGETMERLMATAERHRQRVLDAQRPV